jgi:hypothetical protein
VEKKADIGNHVIIITAKTKMEKMKVTRTSMFSGITRTIDLPVTEEQIARWERGELIQTAMPNLSPDQREFIMTGVTKEEWEEEFGTDAEF